jgi:glycosyltransferase
MKNLFIITEGERASNYGIGTYIKELTFFLKKSKNLSLTVIQLFSREKEFKIERFNGFDILYFPSIYISNPQNRYRYYRNVWYILNEYFDFSQRKTDNIIFHLNFIQEYELIKYIRVTLPFCKIIFTIHYHDWCFILNGDYQKFNEIMALDENVCNEKEQIIRELYNREKEIYEAVNEIICISSFSKEILINNFNIAQEKISVIHNGVENNVVILEKKDKIELRKDLGFSEEVKIVLFVGRLDEIKGVDILIDSFKEVEKIVSNCHLVIVGEGNFAKYLMKTKNCWSKITFTGYLEKEDVNKLYQIADIGIIPSYYEEFGYVVIEMLKYKLPLLLFCSGGINDIIEVYKDENMIEYININEITTDHVKNHIIALLFKEKKFNTNFYFDNKKMGEKYLKVYNSN